MSEPSYFRGYNSIQEIVRMMEPLVAWMKTNKPDVKELTLKRPDYDLIKRWPKAASIFSIQNINDELYWSGLRLKYDKKPPRYSKREAA